MHAAIGLAIVLGDGDASGSPASDAAALENELVAALEPLHFELFGIRNYSNDMMAAASLVAVSLLEPRARTRAGVRAALFDFLEAFRGEGNAFFCSLAAFYGIRDGAEETNALRNLLSAPADLCARPLDPEIYRGIERRFLDDRKGRERSLHALPLGARAPSSNVWRSDPFVFDSAAGADGSICVSGVDLVLAYWMGRYSGWIPAPAEP
ncbi:MAG: hypothetical protein L0Z55_06100 [Planctomycetes bacterium]|nr:hypothetical protein [Planctomycetota bacterium]